jgi:hypothetical protein
MTDRSPWTRRVITAAGLFVSLVSMATILGAQQPVPTPVPAPDPGASPATGTPRLVVEMKDFNYGRVIQGELVQNEFIVRNDGDGPLLIKNVQAT